METKIKTTMTNFEEWTTTEMFECLQVLYVIDPEDKFEDWKNCRTDMIQMLIDNQIQ